MDDVEILVPDEPPSGTDIPPPRRGLRTVAPLLALAGAAVAVGAPFANAYRLQLPGFAGGDLALDGWGRYDTLRDYAPTGQHGPRVGIVYCVAAGLAVLGVLLWQVRASRARRAGSGAILGAAGAALAAAAATLLDAQASADSYQVALRDNRPSNVEAQLQEAVRLTPGPMLWAGLVAGALLVAAVVARAYTPVPPEPAPDTGTGHGASAHPDDEVLGDSSRTGEPSNQASTSSTASS